MEEPSSIQSQRTSITSSPACFLITPLNIAGTAFSTILPAVFIMDDANSFVFWGEFIFLSSPSNPTKGSEIKSFSQALKYNVWKLSNSRYAFHISTNVVLPVPHLPSIAKTNPFWYVVIMALSTFAYFSRSNLQFRKGWSAGISNFPSLQFIVRVFNLLQVQR